MSWPALAWAKAAKVGNSSEKLILIALADRHNEDCDLAFPSVAWLCEFSDLNRKTVIAALSRLEAKNLISDSGERVGRTNQIKAYRLHLETVPKTEQSQKRNGSGFSREQSQKRDTDTVREPVSSEAKASSLKRRTFPAPFGVPNETWADFMASPKRRKAGMSPTAYAAIANNLRTLSEHGYPPGEMVALAVERGWTTVKLEWVKNDARTNSMARHQSDGLSSTARAALDVFGGARN